SVVGSPHPALRADLPGERGGEILVESPHPALRGDLPGVRGGEVLVESPHPALWADLPGERGGEVLAHAPHPDPLPWGEREFRNARLFRRRSRWCSSWDCSTPSREAITGPSSFRRRYVARSPDAIRRSTLIVARGTRSIAGAAHWSHKNPPASALNAAGLAASGLSHDTHAISCGA